MESTWFGFAESFKTTTVSPTWISLVVACPAVGLPNCWPWLNHISVVLVIVYVAVPEPSLIVIAVLLTDATVPVTVLFPVVWPPFVDTEPALLLLDGEPLVPLKPLGDCDPVE